MENVFTTIEPFCNLARILGFFPLSLDERRSPKVTKFSSLLTFIAFLVCLLVIAGNICHFKYFVYSASEEFLRFSIWSIISILNFIMLSLQMLFNITNVCKIKRFFLLLQKYDEKCGTISVFIDHSGQRKFVKIIIRAVLMSIMLRYIQTVVLFTVFIKDQQKTSFIQDHFSCYFLVYESFFCLQFIIPTFLVRERLKTIKNSLSHKTVAHTKLFIELFQDMCDAIDQINSLLTVHLIPLMLAMLLVDIIVVYKLVRFFFTNVPFYRSCIILSFMVIHFIIRSAVAHFGHSMKCVVQDLKAKVARLIIEPTDNIGSRVTLKEFLGQMESRNCSMETVFFSINWSIVINVS
jgi:hypothetical protein